MAKNRNNAKEFHGFWRVSYPRICGYEFQTRNDLDCRGGTSVSWKAPGLTAHSLSTRPQGSRPTDSCSSTPPSHGHAQDPPRGLILTSNGLSRSNTPVQCCYCHTSATQVTTLLKCNTGLFWVLPYFYTQTLALQHKHTRMTTTSQSNVMLPATFHSKHWRTNFSPEAHTSFVF